MSRENVEGFERGAEAFNNGDVEALVKLADPRVAFHDVFGRMLGGEERIYHGHHGLRDLIDDLRGAGSFASPDAFLDGFAPAIAVVAVLSLAGAVVALALPSRGHAGETVPVRAVAAVESEGSE
jgi:hypothetical protein